MNRIVIFAATMTIAASLLTACGDPKEQLAKATPATGDALEQYSRNISRSVELGKDAALVQRLCVNATGQACDADISEKLKTAGYESGGTGVDLALAFTRMMADVKDGSADLSSSDEDFMAAAYRVALAREPDENGAKENLAFIKEKGERQLMLRSLLESQEFKSLR